MVNVVITLFNCYSCLPKGLNIFQQLIFSVRFDCRTEEVYQFVPYQLVRVHIWAFLRSLPPVDSLLLIIFFCDSAGVLWVIVLHKAMIIARKSSFHKWNKSFFYYCLTKKCLLHDSCKNSGGRCTTC